MGKRDDSTMREQFLRLKGNYSCYELLWERNGDEKSVKSFHEIKCGFISKSWDKFNLLNYLRNLIFKLTLAISQIKLW